MEQNEPMKSADQTEMQGTPELKENTELSESATPITAVNFYRKASSVAELPDNAAVPGRDPIKIEKVVELLEGQYRYFSTRLIQDFPFLAADCTRTWVDEHKVTLCLLVTAKETNAGILVDRQGYGYARYTGYVSAKSRLELNGVPVEKWELDGDRPLPETAEPTITAEMIADGLESGAVAIVDSPHDDGPVCQIGDYWFWFAGSEAEQTTAADYVASVPREDIVQEIMDVLNDFRTIPENRDEYAYYEAFLREAAQNQRESTDE